MRTFYYDGELEQLYDDMLDDYYDLVDICGFKYTASKALKCVDEIAYNCGFNDWRSKHYEELYYEDLTEEELEHYRPCKDTILYWEKQE